MYFPPVYAEALLACAQPLGANGLGGIWSGFKTGTLAGDQGWPGGCMACTAGGMGSALTLVQNNKIIRACNRSIVAERTRDCCVGCRYTHTHMMRPLHSLCLSLLQ